MKTKLTLVSTFCGFVDFNGMKVPIGTKSFFMELEVDENGKVHIEPNKMPGFQDIPRGQTFSIG